MIKGGQEKDAGKHHVRIEREIGQRPRLVAVQQGSITHNSAVHNCNMPTFDKVNKNIVFFHATDFAHWSKGRSTAFRIQFKDWMASEEFVSTFKTLSGQVEEEKKAETVTKKKRTDILDYDSNDEALFIRTDKKKR